MFNPDEALAEFIADTTISPLAGWRYVIVITPHGKRIAAAMDDASYQGFIWAAHVYCQIKESGLFTLAYPLDFHD